MIVGNRGKKGGEGDTGGVRGGECVSGGGEEGDEGKRAWDTSLISTINPSIFMINVLI